MKVLLVDDDVDLLDILAFTLRREGIAVLTANDGTAALEVCATEQPDLVFMDINMGRIDGLEALRRLRQELVSQVPVIMLTVRDSEAEIVRAFDLGADDYIVKPFSPRQLLARARAVVRRSGADLPRKVTAGDVMLDPTSHQANVCGSPVRLTPLEYRLLHALVTHRGQVLPSEHIIERVWGYSGEGDATLLKGLVHRLRGKIEPDPSKPRYIQAVRGVGYVFPNPSKRA
jgi:DNA-binding response OmpR family regulator